MDYAAVAVLGFGFAVAFYLFRKSAQMPPMSASRPRRKNFGSNERKENK